MRSFEVVKKLIVDEIDLPHLKMTVSDHENNPYGIQWQRYWEDALVELMEYAK